MKLKFKQQQYQTEATNAVVRIFVGQEKGFRKETIGRNIENKKDLFEKDVEEIFSNKKLNIDDKKILTNISLSIKKGKVTGMIGGSGSGKTTLIK